MVLSSTFEGVARVATRLPPTAISSNATLSTASWSRSRSLKFTRACAGGKGSGCSPPCVTRWSGGAVVHDRGALLRRGLRRRKTTHHVVELGSQHYRGQFNVVPGTVFFGTGCHFFMRLQHGGRRRAVDALDGHRFFGGGGGAIAAAVVPRGDGCTARSSSAAWLPRLQRLRSRADCAHAQMVQFFSAASAALRLLLTALCLQQPAC